MAAAVIMGATSGASAKVDTPTMAYQRMAALRRPIEALYTHTEGMRAAGEQWLPKEVREDGDHYQRRLARSFLIPLYADGVEKLCSKPFAKPVQVHGDLPEELAGLQDDVDGRGMDLTTFANLLFRDGTDWGELHAIVDTIATPDGLLKDEERRMGVRPYFCRLCPPAVIAAREKYGTGQRPRLWQLRVKESGVEPDGEFGEKPVESVRVWQVGDGEGSSATVTIWKKSAGGMYVAGPAMPVSYADGIPHAYASFAPVGSYESDPPMASLAWLNMTHWQSYSDHRNWLKVTRSTMIAGAGLPEKACKEGLTLADNKAALYTGKDAKLYLLESSGAAMEISFKDLEDLEQKAQLLAMMPYAQQAVAQTATAKSYDEARGESVIQARVRATERAIEQLYRIAASLYGVELPEDFEVEIFSDFGLSLRAMQDAQTLIAMRASNQISQECFLREMKGRGVLGDMVDVDLEISATATEREARESKMAGLADYFKPTPGEPGGPAKQGGEPAAEAEAA